MAQVRSCNKLHCNSLRLNKNTILLIQPSIKLVGSNNTSQRTPTNITKAGEDKGNQERYLCKIASKMIRIELFGEVDDLHCVLGDGTAMIFLPLLRPCVR